MKWNHFDRYGKIDLKYKDQARAIICQHLGFEPPRPLSITGEMTIRKILRKMDNGEDVGDNLSYQLEVQTNAIKNRIVKYAPEYSHLLSEQG